MVRCLEGTLLDGEELSVLAQVPQNTKTRISTLIG